MIFLLFIDDVVIPKFPSPYPPSFWHFSGKWEGVAKRGRIQCFVVVQWGGGDTSRLVNFFLMSWKNNLSILIWGHVQNISSLTVAMSWSTIMWSIFLYLLASSKPPIFTIVCKHVSIRFKAKVFPFKLKRVSYSLVHDFLTLGIWL